MQMLESDHWITSCLDGTNFLCLNLSCVNGDPGEQSLRIFQMARP